MAFCTNCGALVKDGAKFCGVCGSKIEPISQSTVNGTSTGDQRKTQYDGEIHKCPNCGATLKSFLNNCPECGFEFRGTSGVNSVRIFADNYAKAQDDSQKEDLIRTFHIPNTKEDIIEFVILASSNIDPSVYSIDADASSEVISQQKVTDAWMSKYEQAYQKALLVLHDDPNLPQIEKQYFKEKASVARAKKRVNILERIRKNKLLYLIIGGVVLLFILIGLLCLPHAIKVHKLEKKVELVEELIEEGDYDAALGKANQIYFDSISTEFRRAEIEKWDLIRVSLINRIEEIQGKANGQIKIPTDDLYGKQYSDVERLYKKAGFTNVTSEMVPDLILGFFYSEGEVSEVLINGSNSYETGTYVDKDVEVVIKYHGYSD